MPRILIVDDTPFKRDALDMVLTAEGHTITTAVDGVDGLARARQDRPDLIIADMIMPNMDGYDFCKGLRNDPALKEIPIVINSVMDEAKIQLLAHDCDVHYFIPMAARSREILAIINAALEGRPNPFAFNLTAFTGQLDDVIAELKALSKPPSS